MGWSFWDHGGRSDESLVREELEGLKVHKLLVGQPGGDGKQVAYGVLENSRGVKFGLVALYERGPREFGIKLMDSSMGPFYHDFPVAWLDELGEPVNDWDRAWRDRVRAESRNRQLGLVA